MSYIILGNVCFVCTVINDHCTDPVGIVNPLLQLVFCDGSTCRIIWQTQINDVRIFLRELRNEIVLFCAWHVDDIAPHLSFRIVSTGSACHNIGIHINRVNRITYSDAVIYGKNLLDISGITLCSVGYKNLICADVASSCFIVIVRNGSAQELISEIRCITVEGLCISHFCNCTMHCIDNCRCQWLGNITDSKTNQCFLRICSLVCTYFFCNRAEQIAARKFLIVVIHFKHLLNSSLNNLFKFSSDSV